MGRIVTELPTSDNAWDVIAQLKPQKRADWERDARRRGWDFREYVVARFDINIEH
jgi:polysaccharide pyruvyl transferase WcaK-like protein